MSFIPQPLHCRGKNPEPLNRWQGVGFIADLHALKKRQSVPQPGIEPARSLVTALIALMDVLHVFMYMYVCMSVCMCVCVYVYVYIYIYITCTCVYLCMYVRVCMYLTLDMYSIISKFKF